MKAILLLAILLAGGCSKSEKAKEVAMGSDFAAPPSGAVASAPSTEPEAPAAVLPPAWEPEAEKGAPAARIEVGGKANSDASSQGQPDPDEAILASARASGAQCFNGLPTAGAPTRSASIRVTVVPTGRVTRAEVSLTGAGPTETPDSLEGVRSCLRRVGQGLTFSSKNSRSPADDVVRTYSIDITVTANH